MHTRFALIFKVILIIGVPLIIGIIGTVTPLAVSHSKIDSSTTINHTYQPPNTIGSPTISVGSGTR